MQKLIKNSEIYCLLKGSYDGTYEYLQTVDDIFTVRYIRGNLLVWDLQEDGWEPLTKADSIMSAMIRSEISKRKQSTIKTFGKDKSAYIEKCYTVPDDSYIFYKTDSQSGILKIRLAAWGYNYPTRPEGNELTGSSIIERENVNMHLYYGNELLRNKQFSIIQLDGSSNIYTTDDNGIFNFFGQKLEIGVTITIVVDGKKYPFTIEKGKNEYSIDVTQKASIIVKVYLDNSPKQGAKVTAENTSLFTDENGTACFEIEIPQDGNMTVNVEGEYTQGCDTKAITEGENLFKFEFSSPKIETSDSEEMLENEERLQNNEPSSDKNNHIEEIGGNGNPKIFDDITNNPESDEDTYMLENQETPEKNVGQTPFQIPKEETKIDNPWPKILIIIGLIIIIVVAYYVCYQIIK